MRLRNARRSTNVVVVRPQRERVRAMDRHEFVPIGDGALVVNLSRPAWDHPTFTREGFGAAPTDPLVMPNQDLSGYGRRRINVDAAYRQPGNAMGSPRTRAAIQRMMRRD